MVITVTTHICCSESKCANDEINVTLLAVTVVVKIWCNVSNGYGGSNDNVKDNVVGNSGINGKR